MARSDLPAPGLGTSGNDEFEQCATSVENALEMGYRHVDTARMYENERAVGEGIARADVAREEVTLATKVLPANLGYDDALSTARESLERLGVEAVDLLYVHWPMDAYDPEGTLAAFDRLHAEGATRHVGLSNFTPDLLEDAFDRLDAPVFAHQVEMHPLFPQAELVDLAREHDHYLVAYCPLARGEVTAVPELREVADRHGATPAQVSLAWLASHDPVVPIPKATGVDHLRENLAALELELDGDDHATIGDIDRRERLVDPDGAAWNR